MPASSRQDVFFWVESSSSNAKPTLDLNIWPGAVSSSKLRTILNGESWVARPRSAIVILLPVAFATSSLRRPTINMPVDTTGRGQLNALPRIDHAC